MIPAQGGAAQQVHVVDVLAVQERALNVQDWQEQEEEDDRSDIQKLIDNATYADTMLVRDPTGTSELKKIGILEHLQRYPCHGREAQCRDCFPGSQGSLDVALDSWEADGEAIANDSDLIEAKVVVLVMPEQTGQPLGTDLLDVLIPDDS